MGKAGIAVIGIPDGKLLGKILLPARPQGFAVDQEGARIFANLSSLNEVAVIDRQKRPLLDIGRMQDVQENTPIALDEAHHRFFIGAREPARLVVLDSASGRSVTEVPINGDADDLFYDPGSKSIYSLLRRRLY